MKEKKNIKQLHVNIPMSLYKELREIIPEKGMLTALLKRLLGRYIIEVKKTKEKNVKNPIDIALESILDKD